MTEFLVKVFIKNSADVNDAATRERYGTLAGTVGICCNILLFLIKIAVGIASASISIMADAFNNLSDMGSSLITMLGFRLAAKPADPDHPYGHGRLEYISAFIVSGLILLVGFELFKSSVEKILHPETLSFTMASVAVLGVSILIKLWMFLFNRKLGKKIDSSALAATAQDSLNDALTTAAILISVAVMMIFRINIDAYVGLAMALFILWSGFKTAKDTLNPLLGEPLDAETAERLEREILSFDGFLGIHDLVPHNYGPGRCFASVHVEVPADTDIVKCHEQIDLCEKLIAEKTGIVLTIHMDPVETDNQVLSAVKKAISQQIKEIDPRLSVHDFRMTPKSGERTNLIFDVVLPADLPITKQELRKSIEEIAAGIDPTYCCVISFDFEYTHRTHSTK